MRFVYRLVHEHRVVSTMRRIKFEMSESKSHFRRCTVHQTEAGKKLAIAIQHSWCVDSILEYLQMNCVVMHT